MDGVCFDMDGVVVDSEDYWIELERERILPRAVPDEDVPIEVVSGVFYEEIYDDLAAEYDVAVDRETFVGMYEDAAADIYGEEVALTAGVGDLLDELHERAVPVALVTSSPPGWYEIVLDRFDLRDRFDACVSAASLDGPGKPAPDIYLQAAREIDVAPADCLAVEDSLQGTRAASRAGATVVGFGVGEAGTGLDDADVVARSPEELADAVLSRVGSPD